MLKNLSIRTKLLLLLLLPILGLLFFSGKEVLNKYGTLQSLRLTERLVGLSVRTGAVVHELQKERGLSSGYLNARGEKFKAELTAQRQASDTEIKRLMEYLATAPDAVEIVKSSLDAAAQYKERLAETRSRIDSLSIEGKDAFAYYTAINYAYLDVVAAVGRNARQPELMRAAISYFAFSARQQNLWITQGSGKSPSV
jgi:methyl-accepting chemotaxis protein